MIYLVYKLEDEKYLLVINASNIEKDFEWMEQNVKGEVTLQNISNEVAQLAIQGPKAESILQKLTETDLSPKLASLHLLNMSNVDGITDVLYLAQVTQGKMALNYI